MFGFDKRSQAILDLGRMIEVMGGDLESGNPDNATQRLVMMISQDIIAKSTFDDGLIHLMTVNREYVYFFSRMCSLLAEIEEYEGQHTDSHQWPYHDRIDMINTICNAMDKAAQLIRHDVELAIQSDKVNGVDSGLLKDDDGKPLLPKAPHPARSYLGKNRPVLTNDYRFCPEDPRFK